MRCRPAQNSASSRAAGLAAKEKKKQSAAPVPWMGCARACWGGSSNCNGEPWAEGYLAERHWPRACVYVCVCVCVSCIASSGVSLGRLGGFGPSRPGGDDRGLNDWLDARLPVWGSAFLCIGDPCRPLARLPHPFVRGYALLFFSLLFVCLRSSSSLVHAHPCRLVSAASHIRDPVTALMPFCLHIHSFGIAARVESVRVVVFGICIITCSGCSA